MAFINGKMPFMNATAEIDKAGRIVVPKKIREALHLVPGTRLTLRTDGESIIVQQESRPRGLHRKNGILVYDAGPLPPLDTTDLVDEDRQARMDAVWGNRTKL
jgi:AbrB family looped-hinge helix DNA binding protein